MAGKTRLRAASVLAAILVLGVAAPAAAAGERGGGCAATQVATADGCVSFGEARAGIESIVDDAFAVNGLRAALVRVDLGGRNLSRLARGESMAGVPARMNMSFRIGSMAIPHLVTLLLQLEDEGRLSLDDPVSNWMPQLANSDAVTLRMLANNTSGYPDWVQDNHDWPATLFADPFRQWRQSELLQIAFDRPLACDPGTCFHYAHTNFLILQKIIKQETGESVARQLRREVLRPYGLERTRISAEPAIPEPVLHAYYGDRGPYEDSTYWSPSWTIGHDTIMTGTVGDIARTARGIGTGATLSERAARERFAPATAGLGSFTPSFFYGLGILVENGWQWQNPNLTGYTGIQAYFPDRDIALGLTVTNGPEAASADVNHSQRLFNAITAYLTPGNPVTFAG